MDEASNMEDEDVNGHETLTWPITMQHSIGFQHANAMRYQQQQPQPTSCSWQLQLATAASLVLLQLPVTIAMTCLFFFGIFFR
jgi:hypothetical protein